MFAFTFFSLIGSCACCEWWWWWLDKWTLSIGCCWLAWGAGDWFRCGCCCCGWVCCDDCCCSADGEEDGSYFRGRPRDKWRRFTNSLSSTIQNEPKSSSYLTKHLCNDKFVRIAFYVVNKVGKGFTFIDYWISTNSSDKFVFSKGNSNEINLAPFSRFRLYHFGFLLLPFEFTVRIYAAYVICLQILLFQQCILSLSFSIDTSKTKKMLNLFAFFPQKIKNRKQV